MTVLDEMLDKNTLNGEGCIGFMVLRGVPPLCWVGSGGAKEFIPCLTLKQSKGMPALKMLAFLYLPFEFTWNPNPWDGVAHT